VPHDPFSHFRLGLIARGEKAHAEAVAHFESALAANPQYIDALARIAAVKAEQGRVNEAIDRVTRQLQAFPDNPLIHNLLGRLWMQAGNPGRAEEAFKQGVKLNPALPLSYLNLAELYDRTGHLEEAMHEYQTALQTNPKLASAHSLLGMIHERRQEFDQAKVHYQEALKLDPKFAPAANNLAWIYAERGGDVDAALALARSAREQLPQDPSVADTLGWVYYKKNAYLRAIGFLKEAAEKMPDNPLVHYHLGMAYFKNGDAVSARKTLQLSLKLNRSFPGSEEAQQTLKALKEI
jgi:tetratricopeptide (TPR) repeat protein